MPSSPTWFCPEICPAPWWMWPLTMLLIAWLGVRIGTYRERGRKLMALAAVMSVGENPRNELARALTRVHSEGRNPAPFMKGESSV